MLTLKFISHLLNEYLVSRPAQCRPARSTRTTSWSTQSMPLSNPERKILIFNLKTRIRIGDHETKLVLKSFFKYFNLKPVFQKLSEFPQRW